MVKTSKKSQGMSFAFLITFFLLSVLLLLLTGLYLQYSGNYSISLNKQREIDYKTAKAISEASISAATTKNANKQAAEAAHSVVIPQKNGRSVNVPILTYHYIGNNPNPADKARDALEVTPDKFEAQMDYLSKNGYNSISLDTMYAALKGGQLPPKPIILTFDDGYIDFYTNAFPILRRFNLHAVSFIPTGLMDKGYYMSWAQIKEIDATGLVSFQAHSVNHLNLAVISSDKLTYQLTESKNVLQSQLGKPVNFMAYPYGSSSETVWNAVKGAGYMGAVGTYYGTTESEGNIFNMPRIKVSGFWSLEEFAKKI